MFAGPKKRLLDLVQFRQVFSRDFCLCSWFHQTYVCHWVSLHIHTMLIYYVIYRIAYCISYCIVISIWKIMKNLDLWSMFVLLGHHKPQVATSFSSTAWEIRFQLRRRFLQALLSAGAPGRCWRSPANEHKIVTWAVTETDLPYDPVVSYRNDVRFNVNFKNLKCSIQHHLCFWYLSLHKNGKKKKVEVLDATNARLAAKSGAVRDVLTKLCCDMLRHSYLMVSPKGCPLCPVIQNDSEGFSSWFELWKTPFRRETSISLCPQRSMLCTASSRGRHNFVCACRPLCTGIGYSPQVLDR